MYHLFRRRVNSLLNTVAIAPPAEVLTFARQNHGRRLLLVTDYRDGIVEALDIARALDVDVTDPIELLTSHGYDRLAAVVEAADARDLIRLPATDLGMPIDFSAHHVAAATNFPEHAGEVSVEDGPFLFPKLVTPTTWNARVAVGDALLDYEAEIAWVPLAPIIDATTPSFGLILVNDYTDRDTLLRQLDVDDIASGKGFTTGRSLPDFLPVGNLFVVPRNLETFSNDIVFRL